MNLTEKQNQIAVLMGLGTLNATQQKELTKLNNEVNAELNSEDSWGLNILSAMDKPIEYRKGLIVDNNVSYLQDKMVHIHTLVVLDNETKQPITIRSTSENYMEFPLSLKRVNKQSYLRGKKITYSFWDKEGIREPRESDDGSIRHYNYNGLESYPVKFAQADIYTIEDVSKIELTDKVRLALKDEKRQSNLSLKQASAIQPTRLASRADVD